MQYEEIIECPITGVEMCYKTQVAPGIFNYMSMVNGFYTNSLMKEGEDFYEEQMETLPELYKDIAWVDPKTNLTWIPNVINESNQYMLFASGSGKGDWGWKAVKSIKLSKAQQKQHPLPGKPGMFMEYKMDMKNAVEFKPNEYILALNYLGVM